MLKRNLITVFLNLTTILKLYMALPTLRQEDERNFFKLSMVKTNFLNYAKKNR